jgi:hypothetical protein
MTDIFRKTVDLMLSFGPGERMDLLRGGISGEKAENVSFNKVKTYNAKGIAGKVREAVGRIPGFDKFVEIKGIGLDNQIRYVKMKDILSRDTIANNLITDKEKIQIAKAMLNAMTAVKTDNSGRVKTKDVDVSKRPFATDVVPARPVTDEVKKQSKEAITLLINSLKKKIKSQSSIHHLKEISLSTKHKKKFGKVELSRIFITWHEILMKRN